jgi:hypothetical protein
VGYVAKVRCAFDGVKCGIEVRGTEVREELISIRSRVDDVLAAVDQRDRAADALEGRDGMWVVMKEEFYRHRVEGGKVIWAPVPKCGFDIVGGETWKI